jgi:hypothetical protein
MNRSFNVKGLNAGHRAIWGLPAVFVLVVTMIIGNVPTGAQAVYGSIFGTATDSTGAAIPNATITVTDVSKGITVTAKTNDSGLYRVQHLIPDTYRVQGEAQGFQKFVVDNVIVYADTAPQVDVHLAVGSVQNTVEVTGGAPLLQTDRADVSTVLNARAVENLPNFNRNFTEFELLTPGTTYIGWSVGEGSGNPQQSQQIEVNGQLPFATGYELDGTDNQDPIIGVAIINPNLDSVSEMKVTSQNYDAEFGKAVAGLVTAQTKSGSNAFHGTGFEYRRSSAQQALDPFADAPPNNFLPPTLHNQFGGSVGGPVLKDKLFFFGDYQGLREKSGYSTLTTVPTALAETSCTSGSVCNLSDYLTTVGQIYQPLTLTDASNAGRTPFPDNMIPAADLSPAAVSFFKLLPAPNTGAVGQVIDNFDAQGFGIFNTNQFDVRIDQQRGEKLHLFGRYTYFGGALSGAPFFGAAGGLGYGSGTFAGTDSFRDQSLASGGDYVVTPKWLTDFRFAYYRIYNNIEGPNYNVAEGNDLGIPNANTGDLSLDGGLPQFNISVPSNGTNNGNNIEYGTSANPDLQQESQYQAVNNWSHQIGNHNIKFGVDYRYGKDNSVSLSGSGNVLRSGDYNFAASRTSGGPTSDPSVGVGFATFLLGDATSFSRTVTQSTNGQSRQTRFFTYAQDQWRATPKLSVNYGLRWELYTPESVTSKGGGGLLNIQTGILGIAGYGDYNNHLNVQNNFKEFAPRFGVAYQVDPKTVVRGGYGIVYGQGWAGNTFGEVLTGSYPLQVEQSLTPVSNAAAVFNLTTAEDGIQAGPPIYTFPAIPADGEYVITDGVSQTVRPQKMRLPTVGSWNLMVQRELTNSLSFQIGYIGSEAYHNMFDSSNQFNANEDTYRGFDQINPATGVDYTALDRAPFGDGLAQSLFGVTNFGVPHGWTQTISDNYNEATESYNALQVVVDKRYKNGFQFLSHYTWSHAIDHESYQFAIDPKIGRGNSYYNRRNAFVFAGTYDLPFGKDKMFSSNRFVNQVIGGFQVNATWTLEGGLPFTTSYQDCSDDNDIANDDGACFLNRSDGLPTHKGAFNAVGGYVPYFKPSPYVLTMPGTADNTYGVFSRPATDTFGNTGRDALWGPGYDNVDASVSKSFTLRENLKLQFIAQAFNVGNHVNLGEPDSCYDCTALNGVGVQTAGTITSTVADQDGTSMRRLQFAARISF